MAYASIWPAPVISSLLNSSSNLSGQLCHTSWRAAGGRVLHHRHLESSLFGRQHRCNVLKGVGLEQCVHRSGTLVGEHAQQAFAATFKCAAIRNRSVGSPVWTAVTNMIKVYISYKLCSCFYFILYCVFGASRIRSPAACALDCNLHYLVGQSNGTTEDLLSGTQGLYGRPPVVCLNLDYSVPRCLEPASKQEIFQRRSDSISGSETWRSWDMEEKRPSVRQEYERGQSGIVFVGVGQGRRRKSNSFVKRAADLVGPAVVRLDTERDFPTGEKEVVQTRDRLFGQWFGEPELPNPRKFRRERGQGSGFVLNGGQGLVVTNAHVVKGADRVKVTFTDGRVYDGEVIGTDDVTDLALIKVAFLKGEVLPTALLGDSRTVELGDWVIAVGNPFGLDNTVSLGIISNLHRTAAEVGIPDKRLDFLQTDCAINPGNSGGPLLNEFGEVIGINTAIRADAEGISFAIPINKARKIIDALGEGKPVQHPFLGIQMATLSIELARHYNADPNTGVPIPEAKGVLIVKVSTESPAAFAGLRSGDVIVEVDGVAVLSSTQMQRIVESAFVGQRLDLAIWRGDKGMEVTVETGDMAPYFAKSGNGGNPNGSLGNIGNNVNGYTLARGRGTEI